MNLLRLVPKLLLAIVLLLSGAARAEELTVYFFDVGQGDAALIVSPAGKTVLIDGGPPSAGPALGARLKKIVDAPIDLVLLSHAHLDHLGGLAQAIRAVGARMFMEPNFSHPSPAYDALLDTLKERNVRLMIGEAGRNIGLGGGAILKLLHPSEPYIQGSRSDANSNSIVARLTWQEVSFLFTGDAERDTERRLLERNEELRSTVLKVAHHGSRHSTMTEFLDRVRPQLAVISAGAGNDYGHPTRQAMDRIEAVNARIYRTDLDGEIVVKSDGVKVEVSTSKKGVPGPEKKRKVASSSSRKQARQSLAPAAAGKTAKATQAVTANALVGSSRSGVFHLASCHNARKIKPDNLVTYEDRDAALAAGKRPAKDCNP